MDKRRLDLWPANDPAPGPTRGASRGEIVAIEHRPATPHRTLLVAAAGAAAEAQAKEFAKSLLAALCGAQVASVGCIEVEERRGVDATLELESTLARSPCGRLRMDPDRRTQAAEVLERNWTGGPLLIRHLGLMAVRRVWLTIVVSGGVTTTAQYPVLRALANDVDLLVNRYSPSLVADLARSLAPHLRA